MRKSRSIALGGVFSALALVIMWVGAISGLGTYAAPLLAGVALMPVGMALGKRYHWLSFAAVSLLSALLSADWEQNLLFICLLGWYPIARPYIQRLKKPLRIALKLIIFNVITVGVELLVMLVIAPASEALWLLLVLLALGNLTFFLYDFLLPRIELILLSRLKLGGRRG